MLSRLLMMAMMVFAAHAGSARATVIYTTSQEFTAAISKPGTDTYDDIGEIGDDSSAITRAAGVYGYSITATDALRDGGNGQDNWLTTSTASDMIVLSGFADDVRGVGGFFFASDLGGGELSGTTSLFDIIVTFVDEAGSNISYSLDRPTAGTFLGFVSSARIVSLTIQGLSGSEPAFASVDDLTIGLAAEMVSVVPEPATWSMLLIGFGLVGAAARYRRRRLEPVALVV